MPKAKTTVKSEIIPIERIASSIYLVRGQQVMIDSDLAVLYGVETKVSTKPSDGISPDFQKTSCFSSLRKRRQF